MTVIRNLFHGRYPLWIVVWLIGFPVYVIHNMAGGCALADRAQCGIGASNLMWIILVSGIVTLMMAIPTWRSASNYAGPRWRGILAYVYVWVTCIVAFPMSLISGFALVYHGFTGRW